METKLIYKTPDLQEVILEEASVLCESPTGLTTETFDDGDFSWD